MSSRRHHHSCPCVTSLDFYYHPAWCSTPLLRVEGKCEGGELGLGCRWAGVKESVGPWLERRAGSYAGQGPVVLTWASDPSEILCSFQNPNFHGGLRLGSHAHGWCWTVICEAPSGLKQSAAQVRACPLPGSSSCPRRCSTVHYFPPSFSSPE